MTNELTATPSIDHLPEERLLSILCSQMIMFTHDNSRIHLQLFLSGIASKLIESKDEQVISEETAKLNALKQDNKMGFIINQIIHTSNQLLKRRKEILENAKKEKALQERKTLHFFNQLDTAVDVSTYSLKAITTLLKYGKYLGYSIKNVSLIFTDTVNDVVSICNYTISGFRDIWTGTYAHIDKSQFARKTALTTASIRIARSVVGITLFALSISNPFSFIALLVVGFLAGLYKDGYITYENQQSANQKKAELQKEIDILEKYKGQTFDPSHPNLKRDILEQQQQIITQHTEELEKLKGYSLRNRTRLGIQFFTLIGTGLMVAGVFFPPVFLVGATLLTVATIVKITEKLSSNKISSFFGRITGFLPNPQPQQQASTVPQAQNTYNRQLTPLLQIPPSISSSLSSKSLSSSQSLSESSPSPPPSPSSSSGSLSPFSPSSPSSHLPTTKPFPPMLPRTYSCNSLLFANSNAPMPQTAQPAPGTLATNVKRRHSV